MRVLLIEDDDILSNAVDTHLTRLGHGVDAFRTLDDAGEAVSTTEYAVILLDLNLPDGHGLSFLKARRAAGDETPIIVATAQNKVAERIEGLQSGADDYLIKPYDLHELTARIGAVTRRLGGDPANHFIRGDVCIDVGQRIAEVAGKKVALTAREWAVLEVLLRQSGAAIGRSALETKLYDFGAEIESNSIEVFISRIRKKLGREFIKTERGLGYRVQSTQ